MSVKIVFKVVKKDRKKERRNVLSFSNTITTRGVPRLFLFVI